DPLSDPLVLDRTAALLGDAFLVHLVVVERAVVRHEEKTRQLIVRRRPDRGVAHQEIAVADDADHHASAAFERERRADRETRSRPYPAAAIGAEIIQRMPEVP